MSNSDPLALAIARAVKMQPTDVALTKYGLVRIKGGPIGYLTDEMIKWRTPLLFGEEVSPESFEWRTGIRSPMLSASDKRRQAMEDLF